MDLVPTCPISFGWRDTKAGDIELDRGERVLLFSAHRFLEYLSVSDVWYGDGMVTIYIKSCLSA